MAATFDALPFLATALLQRAGATLFADRVPGALLRTCQSFRTTCSPCPAFAATLLTNLCTRGRWRRHWSCSSHCIRNAISVALCRLEGVERHTFRAILTPKPVWAPTCLLTHQTDVKFTFDVKSVHQALVQEHVLTPPRELLGMYALDRESLVLMIAVIPS